VVPIDPTILHSFIDLGAKPRSAVDAREHAVTMTGMIQHLLPLGLRLRMGFNRE
jgi:hypothetical protein